jgi:hypothetical protein
MAIDCFVIFQDEGYSLEVKVDGLRNGRSKCWKEPEAEGTEKSTAGEDASREALERTTKHQYQKGTA